MSCSSALSTSELPPQAIHLVVSLLSTFTALFVLTKLTMLRKANKPLSNFVHCILFCCLAYSLSLFSMETYVIATIVTSESCLPVQRVVCILLGFFISFTQLCLPLLHFSHTIEKALSYRLMNSEESASRISAVLKTTAIVISILSTSIQFMGDLYVEDLAICPLPSPVRNTRARIFWGAILTADLLNYAAAAIIWKRNRRKIDRRTYNVESTWRLRSDLFELGILKPVTLVHTVVFFLYGSSMFIAYAIEQSEKSVLRPYVAILLSLYIGVLPIFLLFSMDVVYKSRMTEFASQVNASVSSGIQTRTHFEAMNEVWNSSKNLPRQSIRPSDAFVHAT